MDGKEKINFFAWVKYNFWVLFICLAAILTCLIIYGNAQGVLAECNDHYQQEFKENCVTMRESMEDGFNFTIENKESNNGVVQYVS